MSIDLNIEIRLDDPRILNWLKNGGKGDLALEKDASYTEKLDLEYYPSSEKQYSTTTKHVQSWTLNIRYYALVREDPKPPHYRQRLSEVEISVPMRHSLEYGIWFKLYVKKSLPVESKKLIYQFYSNFSMAKGDPSDYLEQCLQTDEAKDAGIDRHSFKVLAYPVFSQNQQPERFDDAAKKLEELYHTGPDSKDKEYFARNHIFLIFLREESGFPMTQDRLDNNPPLVVCDPSTTNNCPPDSISESDLEKIALEEHERLGCSGETKTKTFKDQITSIKRYKYKERTKIAVIDCIIAVILQEEMLEYYELIILNTTVVYSKQRLDETLIKIVKKCIGDSMTPAVLAIAISNPKAAVIMYADNAVECLKTKIIDELPCMSISMKITTEYTEPKKP